MSKHPHKYTKLPIKEAIFDFQIRGGPPFNEQAYQQFLDKSNGYTVAGKIQNIDIATEPLSTQKNIIGYRCAKEENKQIAQFKKHGFSFSRLEPYIGWDNIYKEALRLWQIYCEIRKPDTITRVAVRFINQFQIPDIWTSAKEYFKSYIQYDKSISPTWNQIAYKLLLSHNQGIKSHIISDAIVNQHTQSVNVLLDIDVFADGLALSHIEDSKIENLFKTLRKTKNDIFEQTITDKTREMIK